MYLHCMCTSTTTVKRQRNTLQRSSQTHRTTTTKRHHWQNTPLDRTRGPQILLMKVSNDIPDLSERLEVLLKQERTRYLRIDYLGRISPTSGSRKGRVTEDSCCSSSCSSSSSSGINEKWRERICEWSYQVVDHFDFNREIVSVSLSYLDRFLSTRRVNQKIFQLAAMTTLYLAVKLYEPGTLKISSLIKLSRGHFKVEHVMAMEKTILRDLSWYMHPPTSQCLARHFIMFLPNDTKDDLRRKQDVIDMSHFLMELSVCDYFFVTRKPSSIALAAILKAIEFLAPGWPDSDSDNFATFKALFLANIGEVLPYWDISSDEEVMECLLRQQEMYYSSVSSQQEEEDSDIHQSQEVRVEIVSPVCVSAVVDVFRRNGDEHPLKQSSVSSRSPSAFSTMYG